MPLWLQAGEYAYAIEVNVATEESVAAMVSQTVEDVRRFYEVKVPINRVLFDLTPKPTGTIEWECVLQGKTQL